MGAAIVRNQTRLDTAHSTSLRASLLAATGLALAPRCHRDAIRDSRITTIPPKNPSVIRAKHEWLFRLRFAQSRVAQLDLAPILAAFASRSVISMPPRFARDYSVRATLAAFAETHLLRTSDAERDQRVSRKPSLHAIRESRIASSPRGKTIDSILPALGLRPTLRIVYVAPLPRAPLTRLHPAFSPFGLPVHLIVFPAFRFVCSSSFKHSACPLRCSRRRFGTGRPCF